MSGLNHKGKSYYPKLLEDTLGFWPLGLHGTQVGAATPLCLKLHGEEDLAKQVQALLSNLDSPTRICELVGVTNVSLEEIFKLAPGMRPGRKTVLERYSVKELALLA